MARMRIAVAALAATALLAAAVGVASANKLSFSSQTFRMRWASFEFVGEFETTKCALTLEGSFHSRTITKVAGATVGQISRATAGNCTEGEVILLTEALPWNVAYGSFTGALPNITAFELLLPTLPELIRNRLGTERCLYLFVGAEPGGVIANLSAGTISSLSMDESKFHILWRELTGSICTFFLRPKGSGSMTVLGSTTTITVRLI